ncbi:MAG TPA: N-acetylmuramoyl-L-alanine amidase [Clostridia bacterium]|nr:N-acetylmuramoyl-L-alanine amidase [Clostridia bacterium]
MGRFTMAVFVPKRYLFLSGLLILHIVLGIMALDYWIMYREERKVLATGAQVILDPGHGGVDPGALSGEVKEKDIVLDVVQRMSHYLEEQGYSVVLTRDADVDLGGELAPGRHRRDLQARVRVINQGQVAVSVHCNTIEDSSQRGAVVFYQKGSEAGKQLAAALLGELNKVQLLNDNRPLPRENLFLLRTSRIPTVIVELGFLSNQEDRQKLMEPGFRQQLAEALSRGIINYLEQNALSSTTRWL